MKRTVALMLCALGAGTLLICGCSTAKYVAYEGSDVIVGKGGEMRPVDGIEFWTSGDPARKYRILGMMEEPKGRHTWALDPDSMARSDASDRDSEIARTARKNGGDGVLFIPKSSATFKPMDAEPSVDTEDDPAEHLRYHRRPRFTMVVIKYVE